MELISKLGMSGKTTLIKHLYHQSTINETLSLILDAISDEYVDQMTINKLDSLFDCMSGNQKFQHIDADSSGSHFSTTIIIDPDAKLINIVEHTKLMSYGQDIYDTDCIVTNHYDGNNPVHVKSLLLSQVELIIAKANKTEVGEFDLSSIPESSLKAFINLYGNGPLSAQRLTEIYLSLVTEVQQLASLTVEPVSMVYRLQVISREIDTTAPNMFQFDMVESREKTAYQVFLTSASRFLIDPDQTKDGIFSFLAWDGIVNSRLLSMHSEDEAYELMKSMHRDVYKTYEVYYSSSSYRLDALSKHKKILSLHIGKEDNSRVAFVNSNSFQTGIDLMPGTYLRHITESKVISWINKDLSKHQHTFCLYNFHNAIVDNINALLYTLLDYGSTYSGGKFTSAGKNFVQYLRQKGVNFAASNDLLFDDNNMNAISTNDHVRTALYAEAHGLQPRYSALTAQVSKKTLYNLMLDSLYQLQEEDGNTRLFMPDGTVIQDVTEDLLQVYKNMFIFPFMSWRSDRFIPLTKSENLERGSYNLEFMAIPFTVKGEDKSEDTLMCSYKKFNFSPTTAVVYINIYNATNGKVVISSSQTIQTVAKQGSKDTLIDQQYKQIYNYLNCNELTFRLEIPSSIKEGVNDFLILLKLCLLTKMEGGILKSQIPLNSDRMIEFFDNSVDFSKEFISIKSLIDSSRVTPSGKSIAQIVKSLPFKFGAICGTKGIELINY